MVSVYACCGKGERVRERAGMYDTLQYIKSAAPWTEGIGHIITMAGEREWVCAALAGPV